MAAAGITLNVTLCFTARQYRIAREAVWRGAQRFGQLDRFKSVYSIFVSRVDVYTEQHVPDLSPQAQGRWGSWARSGSGPKTRTIGTPRICRWKGNRICQHRHQKAEDPPTKYVAAFAGSDIETNPPATNEAVEKSGLTFTRQVDQLPPAEVLAEIDRKVNVERLEATLMTEGIKKFAEPQKALLALIAQKRQPWRPLIGSNEPRGRPIADPASARTTAPSGSSLRSFSDLPLHLGEIGLLSWNSIPTPCPGGTGKKVKFCCPDLTTELDKLSRMVAGEQGAAALEMVEKLEAKYPDRACLLSTKTMLLAELGQSEQAAATAAAFARSTPTIRWPWPKRRCSRRARSPTRPSYCCSRP